MKRSLRYGAALALLLAGCGPAQESSSDITSTSATPAGNRDSQHHVQNRVAAEVGVAKIEKDIIGRVVKIRELTGSGPETEWTFDADEFKHVDILESRVTESGLTLVIFMATRNNPGPGEDSVQVSGKLQLQYERKSDQWMLITVESLTFAYSVGQST
jgi:hypothetical protein